MILSGIAIWKPVQTYPLELLFGGFQGARVVHFIVMAGIVFFLIVHVALTLLVPRTLLAMVVGRATEPRHRHIGGRAMTLARRQLLRGGLSLGALTLLTGCDLSDHDDGAARAGAFLRMERQGAGGVVQPAASGADVSRSDGGEGFPLQRVVRPGEGAAPRSCRLSAAARRPDRQQAAVDRR